MRRFTSNPKATDQSVQLKRHGNSTTRNTHSVTSGSRTEAQNHTGMPLQLKTGLEALSGIDLSGVRVHGNSAKPAQVDALAFTQGQDIHVGPGQEKHLPHEGGHTVQQMQGRVKPTIQAKGVSINGGGCPKFLETSGIQAKLKIGVPNDVYEQEADRVADQVMRMTEPKVQKTSQANTNSNGTNTRLSVSKASVPIQRQEDERGVQIKLRAINLPQRQ
jgi:hypothetical protein